MMSILTRPRPPRADEPADAEAPEALIEEARRRARRRRRGYAAAALVAGAAGLLVFYGFNHGGGSTRSQVRAERPTGAAAVAPGDAARWRLAAGIPGADIDVLVLDPQHPRVMFAVASGDVFKSTDGAHTWRFLNIAPNTGETNALAIAPQDPKTLYAGTGAGVFKTTDGGASWQAANSGLFGKPSAEERQHRLDEGYVSALAVDSRDPDIAYAGTTARPGSSVYGDVFKSTNGGASWRSFGLARMGDVYALALDPTDSEIVYASRDGFAGGDSGVYKSTDGGTSWRLTGLRRGVGVDALVVDPKHPKTVYAVTDRKGIFKSSDGGASWGPAGLAGKQLGRLLLDPHHPETLYAQAGARIFKSRDGARTWQALAVGRAAELLALHPRHSARLYAGSVGRILTSPNAGRSWRAIGRGPGAASISAFAVDARTGTAYAWIGGGIATRTGGRWRTVNTHTPLVPGDVATEQTVRALAVDPRDPDVVYAGIDDSADLLKSTDGGRSWRGLKAPWQPWVPDRDSAVVSALFVAPENPKAVYAYVESFAGNGSPVWFKSTDGGATWEWDVAWEAFFFPADGADSYPSALAFDPLDPDTLYAYGGGAALFKSTNGGATWQRAGYPTIPASLNVENLAIDPREPATLYAAAGEQDGSGEGIFKSTDAGSSWRAVGLKGHNIWSLAIDPRHRQTVYAGTDSGLFRSTDGGRSWSRFSRGLPPDGIETVAVDPFGGILYAVLTGGGIYELRLPR